MKPTLHLVAILALACLTTAVFAGQPGKGDEEDPYNLLPPPGATRDTADEKFLDAFTASKAAKYLDLRRHNVERDCFACHSSSAYMAARPLLDPLAEGVVETRALMERFAADFTAKPPMAKKGSNVSNVKRAEQVLAAVGMAQHDAASTGRLQPGTRKALDHLWASQLDDGGIGWVCKRNPPRHLIITGAR